jgi:Tfp pilus assembly protein PilX
MDSENGVALIIAMMAMLLMMALGAALVMTTSSETLIANNYRKSSEAFYAADAVLERALDDLLKLADWDPVLNGSAQSTFVDGLPLNVVRTLQDGSTIKLDEVLNRANCHKTSACTSADMDAISSERPWGGNNPRWQAYAHGHLHSLLTSASAIDSPYYVVLLAGDDPSENDGDPARDGASDANPGSGVIALRAEAFGPGGAYKLIEATVGRTEAGVCLLSWRERR